MTAAPNPENTDQSKTRVPILDGWRGISILLVLAGHMLPIGPKWLKLNAMVSASGLSLFFFLSGFLVVSMLLKNDNIISFFIRRLFRILPLAYLALIVLLLANAAPTHVWLANLFFYANIIPDDLLPHGDHLWSLCVEVQFYLAVGLTVAALGRRGLLLVPIACVAVTAARAAYEIEFSIVTWFRIDEILVGGTVALFLNSSKPTRTPQEWPAYVSFGLFAALLLSSHESFGYLCYLRPYIAALLIYSTMQRFDFLYALLSSPWLRYLATTSYALYVIHPLTYAGWLGEGDVVIKYSKRILSFILTFLLAHLSTKYYERHWNELGHRLSARVSTHRGQKVAAGPQPVVNQ